MNQVKKNILPTRHIGELIQLALGGQAMDLEQASPEAKKPPALRTHKRYNPHATD